MPETTDSHNDERCNRHILKVLDYARELIILADVGDGDSEDDGCAVLYGVVRDCAYKMRAQAEREREAHRAMGRWEQQSPGKAP